MSKLGLLWDGAAGQFCRRFTVKYDYLIFSGMRITYDLSKAEGSRVVDLQVLCSKCIVPRYVPIEEDNRYQFIAPAFLVSGGDGYIMIKNHMTKHHIFGKYDLFYLPFGITESILSRM